MCFVTKFCVLCRFCLSAAKELCDLQTNILSLVSCAWPLNLTSSTQSPVCILHMDSSVCDCIFSEGCTCTFLLRHLVLTGFKVHMCVSVCESLPCLWKLYVCVFVCVSAINSSSSLVGNSAVLCCSSCAPPTLNQHTFTGGRKNHAPARTRRLQHTTLMSHVSCSQTRHQWRWRI